MKNRILSLTKNSRKVLLFLTITIFMLTTLLSYAYLNTIASDVTKTEIEGTGSELGSLTFNTVGSISMVLNSETFGANADDVSNTITSTVTGVANSSNDLFEVYYNAYIVLENEFVYSTTELTPEIILTITDGNDNEVIQISGLTYSTVYGGFDITTENGTIKLLDSQEMSTTATAVDNWTFTVTLIAHDFDQSINEGNNFNATIYLSLE